MQTELDRLSRMRQSLSELAREAELLMPVFMDRMPMVKGTVYEQRANAESRTAGAGLASNTPQ